MADATTLPKTPKTDSVDPVFGDICYVNSVGEGPGDIFTGKNVQAKNILGDGVDGPSSVELVQMMPRTLLEGQTICDYIAKIARTSYADGTKTTSDNVSLVRYLIRHKHTTPLEFVQFVFIIRVPLPIMTQILRHRTFSFNAESARYSVTRDEKYLPPDGRLATQNKNNKQGSSDQPISPEHKELWDKLMDLGDQQYLLYKCLVDGKEPMSREVARFGLPQNMYTTCCARVDQHNLGHFLYLRRDKHAQYEVRRYADAIYQILCSVVPDLMEAYNDYVFGAVTFTRLEIESLRLKSNVLLNCKNSREKDEYVEKLKENGLFPLKNE